MNLHIFNDEKFFDPFASQLEKLNLMDNNKFIIKKDQEFKYIKRTDLVTTTLYSKKFKELIGDVSSYEKVFIHCFTFDLYKWVMQNEFQELNWLIWGSDLYELNYINYPLYEPETKLIAKKVKNLRSMLSKYYRKAEHILLSKQLEKIYGKIDHVLTWIHPEYELAKNNIKGLSADHKYFLYCFNIDFETIAQKFESANTFNSDFANNELKCVLGNSGAITNNHIDAIEKIKNMNFQEVMMPVSYGNKQYVELLKNQIQNKYSSLKISYAETFTTFENYLNILNQYQVFIYNSLRPLGMGNVWIGLLMGKMVFLNPKNFIYDYMLELGLQVYSIDNISFINEYAKTFDPHKNKSLAIEYFSGLKIDKLYTELFSA